MVRAMEYILAQRRKRHDCRITVSFYEIYNEKIYDLLCSTPKSLEMREGKNGEISILGLLAVEITDDKEALSCIAEGLRNRVTSSTSGNIKSSRSHSIFQIKCERLKMGEKQSDDYEIVVSNVPIPSISFASSIWPAPRSSISPTTSPRNKGRSDSLSSNRSTGPYPSWAIAFQP